MSMLKDPVKKTIASTNGGTVAQGYEFIGGYPTNDTVQKGYDEADLNRAIQLYRFFYPTVSIMATWKGNLTGGAVPNKVFAILDGTPQQLVFTPNSDTRYAGLPFDLSETGPMVVELPAGPIMAVVNDMNQLYVMDMGLPGPDKGKGGKHIILPPGYTGNIPPGYYQNCLLQLPVPSELCPGAVCIQVSIAPALFLQLQYGSSCGCHRIGKRLPTSRS